MAEIRTRIRPFLLVVTALLGVLPPATAEERVVARLSQSQVAITTNFSGSEIFVYGAVRREAPIPAGELDAIIAITGPSTPVLVRRKEQRYGIWINGPGVQIDAAPSFYAVAATRPLREILSFTEDMRHRVGIEELIRLIDAPEWLQDDRAAYRDAVVRLRRADGLYYERPDGVLLSEATLFETTIALPANLVEGDYRARILLLRNKQVIDVYDEIIPVQKVGLERFLFDLSRSDPAIYGIASVLMALFAGWMASALFRYFLP